MTAVAVVSLETEILAALATVMDPELDQPITELGFVRSVAIDDDGVTVHLRLPTAFCSPNFAYLMASDALDALQVLDDLGEVRVLLDDHHDSDKINAGLAAAAGYRGTFGSEAEDSLDELRTTFLRKAHVAAMERAVAVLMRREALAPGETHRVTLRDLPDGPEKSALLRRRFVLGLSMCPNARVVVDDDGNPLSPEQTPVRLRFARSVRISMEGNAHFCRGLLATRYTDGSGEADTPALSNTRTSNTRTSNTRTRSPR
ncbi:iron-sulfur cluster assembly protein [Mycobacterium sp. Y57]|uniref:iron-sulfur cluster assembly protein n=1 Tax=Mycolicibacterium xanthum TaxID=2796469 RepID=UPI001C84443B|nr:iron-sulfur cluster assembly protein [Mycolicibacterium xanthum]MBX7434896.1 iron-sulfur cluster assembly protein [Mycolicibacterium xanthum]